MTTKLSPSFQVVDRQTLRPIEGKFILTSEGKLKREIPYYDPNFPKLENVFLQPIEDENLLVFFDNFR